MIPETWFRGPAREAAPFFQAVLVVSLLLLLWAWYYLFWKPFDWCQDFTELGFDISELSYQKYSEATKRNIVNEYHRRRKIGDLPPAFPNGWFVILESDQLESCGVQEVSILGLNLVAWRGGSGKAYVADAYCPHLGAHLGVGGKVAGECITCPFHGWQFRGDTGCLARILYAENIKPELAKLKLHTILEQNGFIYLWFHAEGEKPNWHPPDVPEIQSGEWAYRGRSEFRVACHIQEIPENGADVNHLNTVHTPNVFAGRTPDNIWPSCWGSVIKHVWAGQWKPCEEKGEKHIAISNVYHRAEIFNVILPFVTLNVRAVQIGPGIVHLEFDTPLGRGVLFHMATPIEPLLQRVTHRFYTAPTFLHPVAKLALWSEAVMIARDISIWNRKMFLRNPVLPKEDSAIKQYRLWYQQFYSPNSPHHYFSRIDSNKSFTDF